MHAQSVAFVSKHCLSKAVTQLPRNTEDSAIAHLTPHFSLCNQPCTERALKIDDFQFKFWEMKL